MKKLTIATVVLAAMPALSIAHESHSHELTHAAEHNLANPFFAAAIVAGITYGVYRLVKTYSKKRSS